MNDKTSLDSNSEHADNKFGILYSKSYYRYSLNQVKQFLFKIDSVQNAESYRGKI